MISSRKHTAPTAMEDDGSPPEYSSPACYQHKFESGRSAATAPRVLIKRIYDPAAPGDGFRILVDRLWPRGISKKQAAIDAWARELAPSTGLRKWFHQDRERWSDFCTRYREELREHTTELEAVRQRAKEQPVTLLYASKLSITHIS